MAVADFIRRSMAWALVVLLVAVAATAHAQLSNGDAEEQISDLRKRVDALGARDDVESAVRERVRNTYQQAIASLEAARNARQRTRELREQAGEAPSRIRELKAELAGIEAPPPIDELRALSGGTLASRVDTTSSRLADSQSSLADLRDPERHLRRRRDASENLRRIARRIAQKAGLRAGRIARGQRTHRKQHAAEHDAAGEQEAALGDFEEAHRPPRSRLHTLRRRESGAHHAQFDR